MAGYVLYGKLRPYLDKVVVVDEDGACTTEIIPFHGFGLSNPFYLRWCLKSSQFINYANSSTHGMNLPRLGTDKARLACIPLPPFPEQQRIVVKVDELMALCDQLEIEQSERDALRQRTAKSTLYHLTNTPQRSAAHRYWQSAEQHFPELFDQATTVQDLRSTILQLVVQGRLVPQDPDDEPASELLKRIESEKHRLSKKGKLERSKSLSPIQDNEQLYIIPDSWIWVCVNDIGHDWGQKKPDRLFSYIDVGSINQKFGLIDKPTIVSASEAPSRARKIVKRVTVIYATVRPYLLNIAIIDDEYDPEPIASTAFAVIHPYSGVLASYIYYYLRSSAFVEYVESQMKGMAYPTISESKFFISPFPLPPFHEQQRIMAKVDELMALCDQLEAELIQGYHTAGKLFNAIIYHLFKDR